MASTELAVFYATHILCFVYLALLGSYLLISKRSAFVTDVTPHTKLRKATGLNLILWAFTFLTSLELPIVSAENREIYDNAASMVDMMIVPAMFYMLFTVLQRVKPTRWLYMPRYPIAITLLFAYVILKKDYILIVNWLMWIQYIINVTQLFIRSMRRYNKILLEKYDNLEHKTVNWVYWFVGFFLFYFVLYMTYSALKVNWLAYPTYLICIVAWTYIFYKVEHQDLLKDFWYRPQLVIVKAPKHADDTPVIQEVLVNEDVEEAFMGEEEDDEEKTAPNPAPEEDQNKTTQELSWIGHLIQKNCVETQLYLEEDLTIENFARKVGSNRTYISRYLASQGLTYYTYINKLRIDYALEQIRQSKGKLSYADVAIKSGYRNINTFRRAFKEITGVLPSQYKLPEEEEEKQPQ